MVGVGEEEIEVDEDRLLVELCDTEGDKVHAPVLLLSGLTVLDTVVDTEGDGDALGIDDREPVTLSVGITVTVTLEEAVLETEVEEQGEALAPGLIVIEVLELDDTLCSLLSL
jgi:hypothetical protein